MLLFNQPRTIEKLVSSSTTKFHGCISYSLKLGKSLVHSLNKCLVYTFVLHKSCTILYIRKQFEEERCWWWKWNNGFSFLETGDMYYLHVSLSLQISLIVHIVYIDSCFPFHLILNNGNSNKLTNYRLCPFFTSFPPFFTETCLVSLAGYSTLTKYLW